ncbi:Hypothetical protein NTJ_10080 [Nesidiocoris tenuis]|uniref:Uncharacterized protein n=1 Tax=Nesidiocoris tenuis TaxID=355587 RepID=A0ABN7AYL8_9HEMI|nr:Hypothetical protein NTJ_10080 [Nesidiocoris tenuis]
MASRTFHRRRVEASVRGSTPFSAAFLSHAPESRSCWCSLYGIGLNSNVGSRKFYELTRLLFITPPPPTPSPNPSKHHLTFIRPQVIHVLLQSFFDCNSSQPCKRL